MLSLGLQPSRHGYNLLLAAARDCGLGDPVVASAVLLRPREETALLQPPARGRRTRRRAQVGADCSLSAKLHVEALERQLFLEPSQALEGPQEPEEARAPKQAQSGMETKAEPDHPVALTSVAPEPPPWGLEANLLTPGAAPLAVVSFGTVSTPADRLALMGGLEGFLGKMAEHGLRPDVKTLTLLAEVVEPGMVPPLVLLFRPTHPASSIVFPLTRELPWGESGPGKVGVSPEQWGPHRQCELPSEPVAARMPTRVR